MKEKCKSCGGMYKDIGKHWGHDPTHQPPITPRQWEILKGFLLSDAHIGKRQRNSPRYVLELSNRSAAFWVAKEISNLYPRVSKRCRDEHKDSWRLTVSHESFSMFAGWYDTGIKKYPNNLKLTSVSMSTWYAGDGSLQLPKRDNRKEMQARITCNKESDDWSAVKSAIQSIDINLEPNYGRTGVISFTSDDTIEVLKYMEIVPGYEYKWSL